MVGENFEIICLKLLELPKEPSNKFHDFCHFPKKHSTKSSKIPTACKNPVRAELKMELLIRKKMCSVVGWGWVQVNFLVVLKGSHSSQLVEC